MTDSEITALIQAAFVKTLTETGCEEAAHDAASELVATLATGPGVFDADALTWTTQERW